MPVLEPRLDVEPRSSIVYLLRTTQQHHVQLSAMADQKANMLLGASMVILTLLVNQMISGNSAPLPVVSLAVFTSVAALFAAVAVMPSASTKGRRVTQNPLFFGGFAELEWEDYAAEMKEVLSGDTEVYTSMVRDIWELGRVLHARKYRYLRYSYVAFVSGGVVTLLMTVAWVWSRAEPVL